MTTAIRTLWIGMALCAVISCVPALLPPVPRAIETSLAFTNFSTRFYAALRVREHDASGERTFATTPLLAPGATYRTRFLDQLGVACPSSLDVQLFLYRRVNDDVPIGLDTDEVVEATPVAAGQVDNLPACNVQTLETYTIVNWDAPEGTARIKFAQSTLVEQELRDTGRFPNVDIAWEIDGVDAALATVAPPSLAQTEPIAGRVVSPEGQGIDGVGVLLRTRFRTRLDDDDSTNDPDAGFSEPIAVASTGAEGSFAFARPPGAYRIEFFSDTFSFRPAVIDVEAPNEVIRVVAEAVP